MAEYKTARAVVRVHGDVDRKRLEQAFRTYLANINKNKEAKK